MPQLEPYQMKSQTVVDLTWFVVKYFKVDEVKHTISLNLRVNITAAALFCIYVRETGRRMFFPV